jgi:hypothetical protein
MDGEMLLMGYQGGTATFIVCDDWLAVMRLHVVSDPMEWHRTTLNTNWSMRRSENTTSRWALDLTCFQLPFPGR